MKKIRELIMKNASRIALFYTAMAVFSQCSGSRGYEPELTADLKRQIKATMER